MRPKQPPLIVSADPIGLVAGLPLTRLRSQHLKQTLQAIDKILTLEKWLQAQANRLSDALYPIIGAHSSPQDKQLRYQLVALRRAIFQARLSKQHVVTDEVLMLLPGELATEIKNWYEQIQLRDSTYIRAEIAFQEEVCEKRHDLQKIVRTEAFLQGVLLASKDLYFDILKWLEDDAFSDKYFNRKLELSIFNYLSRLTAKASPYSTFTSFSHGRWAQNKNREFIACNTGSWDRQSVIELNNLIIRHIAFALAQRPEIRPSLTLHANPTLLECGSNLKYISPVKTAGNIAQNRESIKNVVNTPAIQLVLKLIRTETSPSLQNIAQALSEVDNRRPKEEFTRFLESLIARNILYLDFDIPDQAPDYLGQLLKYLNNIPQDEEIIDVINKLSFIHTSLAQYAQAPEAAQRSELFAQIISELKAVYEQLQMTEQFSFSLPQKNFFYENTLIPNLQFSFNTNAWQQALSDLAHLRSLIGLYDFMLPARLALCAFFVDQYGRNGRVNVLDFYETFCREAQCKDNTQASRQVSAAAIQHLFENPLSEANFELPELKQLMEVRQKVVQWIRSQPVDANNCRRLDAELLESVEEYLPRFIRLPISLAFYCQPLLKGNTLSLVLNTVRSGFGRSTGHLEHIEMLASAFDHSARQRKSEPTHGPIPVSIQGVFGSNLNLRVDSTAYEIVYPGYISDRPQEEQLPFSDLWVTYDTNTNRLQLTSQRLQRELMPVQVGTMSTTWFPPMCRFFLRAFGSVIEDPTWNLRTIDRPGLTLLDYTNIISSFPRLYIGNILLDRAHWFMPAHEIPVRDKGESSFKYIVRLQIWREKFQLPECCYIRINAINVDNQNISIEDQISLNQTSKNRKPLYIDFRNHSSIALFESVVGKNTLGLMIEEALPDVDDLMLTNQDGSYTSEYVIELTEADDK